MKRLEEYFRHFGDYFQGKAGNQGWEEYKQLSQPLRTLLESGEPEKIRQGIELLIMIQEEGHAPLSQVGWEYLRDSISWGESAKGSPDD